jgi:hypothetical protein
MLSKSLVLRLVFTRFQRIILSSGLSENLINVPVKSYFSNAEYFNRKIFSQVFYKDNFSLLSTKIIKDSSLCSE